MEAVIEELRAPEIPAMATLVVHPLETGERFTFMMRGGPRCEGCDAKVDNDDLWHLGSCTKAITATLVAVLVKEGRLRWDMPLAEALPALAKRMKPGYRDVTLLELMRMRGGVPGSPPTEAWSAAWAMQSSPTEQRRAFCESVLTQQDPVRRGEHVYSNQSYAILGLVCEEASGTSFEALLRERIAEPLGITTLGFGAPGQITFGEPDADGVSPCVPSQPCGHRADGSRVAPGPFADNPPAITPAGRVHMKLLDWRNFLEAHLLGRERGIPALGLTAEDVKVLHEPGPGPGVPYAGGWIVRKHPRLAGDATMLWHNGSNTMWYAEAAIVPAHSAVIIVVCNSGAPQAKEAVGRTLGDILARFPVAMALPAESEE